MTLLKRSFTPEPRRQEEVEPYSYLANYYNEVMAHVDYVKWSMYITRIVQHYHKQIKTVTDLACGTGKLAINLENRGYKVTGVDGSEAMIERARRFSLLRGKVMDFYIGDLRKTPPVSGQDLVICLYDSINYLMTENDLELFFSSVRLIIRDKGLLIFDCSTEQNSLDHFDGFVDQDKVTGGFFIRRSYYEPEQRIQHNEFDIYPDGLDVMYHEHHRQMIWPIFTLLEIMEGHGFRLESVYDGLTFSPGDEESDRVHIVASPV